MFAVQILRQHIYQISVEKCFAHPGFCPFSGSLRVALMLPERFIVACATLEWQGEAFVAVRDIVSFKHPYIDASKYQPRQSFSQFFLLDKELSDVVKRHEEATRNASAHQGSSGTQEHPA